MFLAEQNTIIYFHLAREGFGTLTLKIFNRQDSVFGVSECCVWGKHEWKHADNEQKGARG